MNAIRLFAYCGIFIPLMIVESCQQVPTNDPHHTSQALTGMKVAEDLEVSLFATEPLLVNPTNIDIDASGRVWVCEGFNYRMKLNPDNPEKDEGDRILVLEDTDNDGKADKKTVFYQGSDINSALGICVLGNKVWISRSPYVFLFEDTDGDLKADEKKVVFSGIGGEQHDHGVHAMVFGPDGRMYFNFGNAGKQLLDGQGNLITDIHGNTIEEGSGPFRQGMIFRCDLNGENVEVLAHNFRNNYEVALNSYGSMWQSDNDDDGNKGTRINYVLEYGNYGFHDEMTGERWSVYRTGMHKEIPKRHWHLNDPGVVPNLLQTGAGSPTGMTVYEGRLLPERFWGQMIHCEPGKQVVRAYPVEKVGAGYIAEIDNIMKQENNRWFRPSDVCVAPDGSLIVSDWYDPNVGGHKMGDWEKGRLFRIAPPNSPYDIPDYDLETIDGTKDALKSPNQAVRYLAWIFLHEQGAEAEEALKTLWETESVPEFQARALWILGALKENGEDYIKVAINDPREDFRIMGLRMARRYQSPHLMEFIDQLSNDTSPQVRREVAVALKYEEGDRADRIWTHLALQHTDDDRWYLEALGIGSDNFPNDRMKAYLQTATNPLAQAGGKDIIWRVRADENLAYLAKIVNQEKDLAQPPLRYLRAFDFHQNKAKSKVILSLIEQLHPTYPEIRNLALNHLSQDFLASNNRAKQLLRASLPSMYGTKAYLSIVKQLALKDQKDNLIKMMLTANELDLRKEATSILLTFDYQNELKSYINSDDDKVRQAALTSLSYVGNNQSVEIISDQVLDESIDLNKRKAAVRAMGQGWNGEHQLWKLVEEEKLDQALQQVAVERLMNAIDRSLQHKAQEILYQSGTETEIPNYDQLLAFEADIENGKKVFERVCQSCHQINGQGIQFGPDLSGIGQKLSQEAIFTSIVHPSSGINFGYEGYIINLSDGNIISGYIESESEDEMIVRMPGGITQTINKTDIDEMEIIEASLMPSGLHMSMNNQELMDLISYLSELPNEKVVASIKH